MTTRPNAGNVTAMDRTKSMLHALPVVPGGVGEVRVEIPQSAFIAALKMDDA